mgnify:CR=1 FL=1
MPAYPNGCHVAEIEIDPVSGALALTRYAAVDDVGTVVNPMIVDGQVHGGVTHGIGQALMEGAIYDDEGQLINGSFMDYAMPRADDFPGFRIDFSEIPASSNPLGVKGGGEIAPVACLPAVLNAVVDALSPLGVTHVEMPATPERLWRTIQDAR